MVKNKVGIIILTFNRADVVVSCIDSLARAKNKTEFELFVIDNDSEAGQYKLIKEMLEKMFAGGKLKGVLRRSEKNLGFPRGNNEGIKYFLGKKNITHICLLNSDVVVTDYWLDRLIEDGFDVVGPVTNACGNEQTIPAKIQVKIGGEKTFDIINSFSAKRNSIYKNYSVATEFLGFFCVLTKKEVFTKVGLLDERFGLGGFEDDDYCVRLADAGYNMFIKRDTFIYHWGGSSFSQISSKKLDAHLENNKKIFEKKHKTTWKDRKFLPLRSFSQDIEYLLRKNKNPDIIKEFRAYYQDTTQMIRKMNEIAEHYLEENQKRIFYSRFLHVFNLLKKIIFFLVAFPRKMLTFSKIILMSKKIIILTRYPTPEDLKDGYFQRVKAVDNLFYQFNRFYINFDFPTSKDRLLPEIIKLKEKVFEIRLDNDNSLHRTTMKLVSLFFARTYIHSILPLDNDLIKKIFSTSRKRVLDIHGVVPEEFKLHKDIDGYKKFNEIEKFAVEKSTLIVSVTNKMADFLRKKHEIKDKKIIVLPIIQKVEKMQKKAKEYNRNIVYCGGLQKWQQVEKMNEFVKNNKDSYNFFFLTPKPKDLKSMYKKRYKTDFPGIVKSVSSDQVKSWYNKCSFGLILREDIIVNNVACPTKLVEYLQNDIIPIVESENIGDFKDLGYQYVSYKKELPDAKKWKEMIKKNRSVLEKIYTIYQNSVDFLEKNI